MFHLPLAALVLTALLVLLVLFVAFGPPLLTRWRYDRAMRLLRQRFAPSPGVRFAMAVRMSWLSVGLRDIGLGSVVDALDGVEGKVKDAVANSQPVIQLEDQSVQSVGNAAQQLVVNAVQKYAPGATEVAEEVTTPLLAGLEAYIEHFIQAATAPKEAPPPAA